MSSKNMTHPFRRIFGTLATEENSTIFCSWNINDCNESVPTDASLVDCIAKKNILVPEDLDGALCCKPLEDVPYLDSIPVCTTDSKAEIAIIMILLFAIIVVCAKSIRNIFRIFLKFGFLSLRSSVGRCAFICALAQVLVVINILSVIGIYATVLVGVSYGTRNKILVVASITLPTALSFAVFATLSMAFNIITVGRTATMQGFSEKDQNTKRLTRLHRIITVVTVVFSILFCAGYFLGGLGNVIVFGATVFVSIFQTWLFHTAAQLMQDLNASIGNDAASRSARSKSESTFGMESGIRNTAAVDNVYDSLLRLQQTSSYISKVFVVCSMLMVLRAVDHFVSFDGELGFNPVRLASALLQNAAFLFFMLILDSITSTLYKNKMRN